MPPLTPEQLAEASARLDGLTQKLEKTVLDDICRRIAKAGAVTDSAEWQMLRLKEMGYANDVIEQAVSEYTKKSAAEVQQLFHEAAQVSDIFYSEMYTQSGKPFVPVEDNPYMQQLISSVVEQTQNELVNLTRSMGFAVRQSDGSTTFKPAAKAYQSALDLAQMQVATGTFDYTTAIRNSVKALTDGGLQFVDYASGHRNRADVAARRAILTGLSQMTGKVSEHNAEELETDIVEVTAHAGARPDHAEWQGRRYSLSGKSKEYRSLEEATGYGTGDGLKGWNCRHDFYPVIPGISPPAYTEEQLANIDPPPIEYNGKTLTYYECTQKQRVMETAMRKTKREIIAAKASGDDDMFTAKSIRLRRQKEEYAKFSDKAGLLTQNERTQVYGFDKSISAKAAWAVKKAQSASGGSPAPAPSGGKAVTVNVPAPASSGKAYTGEKIVKPLDNGGGSGIMKETTKVPAKTLSLSNLNEFEEWQNKYYDYNSGVSFSREDNPNIFTYTGGAYDAINALERGGEQLEKAKRCYRNGLSEYEGIGNKISEELSKFKLPEPINVRRAVGNVDYITGATSSVEDMKSSIGKVFTEKGFTSTTVCRDTILPFGYGSTRTVLDIYVPTNSRGAYIYKISEHPAEFEYLLDKNTKFKIVDAGEREVVNEFTGDTTIERFMKLEVIPDD